MLRPGYAVEYDFFPPSQLRHTLETKSVSGLFFAGQITGVEGYMGNIATGLLTGINAAHNHKHQAPITLPQTTMLGALCHYVTHANLKDFQPMKANFGIMPPLENKDHHSKRERGKLYGERAMIDLENFLSQHE